MCNIHCEYPCYGTEIYAQNSSYLRINACDLYDSYTTCSDMTIYCPNNEDRQNNHNCELNGNAEISNSKIHTKHGFNQLIKDPVLQMYYTTIYCQRNSTEKYCQSNPEGTKCLPPSTDCNEFETLSPTFLPTLYPSGNHHITTTSEIETKTETTVDSDMNNYNGTSTKGEVIEKGDEDETSLALNDENTWEYIGYFVVLGALSIPSLLIIAGMIYNTKFKGSDPPKYLSVLKSFAHVADLYTDVVFCVLLYFKGNIYLFYPAVIFILSAHILSNCVGLYFIHKWREQKMAFIHRYDNLLIAMSVLAGFYPSVELLSCKLFYIDPLSMHLSIDERYRIQQIRFCNDIILENIPLMIIQVLSVISNEEIESITAIAFIFSSISLIIGLLTLISRSCSGKCNESFYHQQTERMKYKIYIKSNGIRTNHRYCHEIFAKCLSYATDIEIGRIEVTQIRPILNGISCNIEIVCDGMDEEQEIVEKMMNEISMMDGELFDSFKTCLLDNLCIDGECKDLQVMAINERNKRLTDSMTLKIKDFGECSPFMQVKSDSVSVFESNGVDAKTIEIQHSVTI